MITDEALKKASDAVVLAIQGYKPTTEETVSLRQVIEAVFTAIVDLPAGLMQPSTPPEVKILTEPDRPGYWWVWVGGSWSPAIVSEREFKSQIGTKAYPYWVRLDAPDVRP